MIMVVWVMWVMTMWWWWWWWRCCGWWPCCRGSTSSRSVSPAVSPKNGTAWQVTFVSIIIVVNMIIVVVIFIFVVIIFDVEIFIFIFITRQKIWSLWTPEDVNFNFCQFQFWGNFWLPFRSWQLCDLFGLHFVSNIRDIFNNLTGSILFYLK